MFVDCNCRNPGYPSEGQTFALPTACIIHLAVSSLENILLHYLPLHNGHETHQPSQRYVLVIIRICRL